MRRAELTDVEVHIHHETKPGHDNEGAVLVSLDGERKSAVWVPKSFCQIEYKEGSSLAVLTLSEAMALDKGLI